MKRRTVSGLLSVAAVLVYASMAVAGPIPSGVPGGVPGLVNTPVSTGTVGASCTGPVTPGYGCGESDLASGVSNAKGAFDGIDAQINVDWMVLAPGTWSQAAWDGISGKLQTDGSGSPGSTVGAVCPAGDCWIYLYQEENTNTPGAINLSGVPDGINIRALTVGPVDLSLVLLAGVFGVHTGDGYGVNLFDDLDCGPGNPAFTAAGNQTPALGCLSAGALHPGHFIGAPVASDPLQITNTNPADEEEGVCAPGDVFGTMGDPDSFCINPADPITTAFTGGNSVAFTYAPATKPPTHETVTLFYVATAPPVYGRGTTQDTGLVWATLQCDPDLNGAACFPATNPLGFQGDPLPIPSAIPEPTTLALFGGGLIVLGLLRRKMKR